MLTILNLILNAIGPKMLLTFQSLKFGLTILNLIVIEIGTKIAVSNSHPQKAITSSKIILKIQMVTETSDR